MNLLPARSGFLRTLQCVFVVVLLQGLYRTDLSAQAPFDSIELNGSGIGSIRRIAWHPNGSLIALAIDDRVAIYDSSLQLVGNLTGHTDLVRGMAWSPSGDLLASASEDNTAKIWDARVAEPSFGDVLLTLVEDDDVFNVSWDNTGTFLVLQVFDHYVRYSDSSDVYTTLKIRDASTGSLVQTLPMQTNSIVPQWDGAGRVVTSSLDERYRIKLWDPALGAFAESRLSLGSRFTSIAFNSTKTLLAAGTANAVVVLDANTLERRFDLYIVSANNSVAWHPSDLYIATGNDDGRLDIWKATNTLYVEFSAHAGRISSIQWNSDGTKLATLSYGDENILKIWDTSGLPTVATEPTATYFPTITPEPTPVTPTATPLPQVSEQIAFVKAVDNLPQLHSLKLSGLQVQQLTSGGGSNCQPSFSADGVKLAYVSPCIDADNLSSSPNGQVYVVGLDSSDGNPQQVTVGSFPNYAPAWSMNSNNIAFVSFRASPFVTDPVVDPDIYVTRADASTLNDPTQLILNDALDHSPDWSINNRVVFVSDRYGFPALFRIGGNGGAVHRIPVAVSQEAGFFTLDSPKWSPEGERIAFVGGVIEKNIYVANATTGQTVTLNLGGLEPRQLDWSPYSEQLVFTARKDGYLQLFVVDLSSRGITQLTSDPSDKYDPAWAPSTTILPVATLTPAPTSTPVPQNRIIFTQRDTVDQIYSSSLDGSSVVNISNSTLPEQDGVWSPDGTRIALEAV